MMKERVQGRPEARSEAKNLLSGRPEAHFQARNSYNFEKKFFYNFERSDHKDIGSVCDLKIARKLNQKIIKIIK